MGIGEEDIQKFLELMRRRVGTITHLSLEHPNLFGRGLEVATRDAIRTFVNGIGDTNPLYRSVDYSRNTRYGGIIASPTFLLAISQGTRRLAEERMPGLTGLIPGVGFEWFKSIHEDDRITAEETYMDPRDLGVKDGARRLMERYKRIYGNQKEEIVGIAESGVFYTETGPYLEKLKTTQTGPTQRYRYSKEELEAIDRAYEEEEIRGGNPRYWDEIIVGEKLKPIVRGPLTHADVVAFFVGTAWFSEAHGIARKFLKKYPAWAYEDPDTNVMEWLAGFHMLDKITQSRGMPMAVGLGDQTFCWLGTLLTNWIGDDGFLKKLSVRFEAPNWHGDTTWCKGEVTKKYVENGQGLIDIRIWGENQKGVVHTTGNATVILPARSLST